MRMGRNQYPEGRPPFMAAARPIAVFHRGLEIAQQQRSHSNTKPHLAYVQGEEQPAPQSGTDALIFIPDTPGV